MSIHFLQSIGLSEAEAQIYDILLNEGEVPAQVIISKSGLKRSTVYTLLYSLEKKRLVTKQDINKIIHFRPEPPTKLLQWADQEIKERERARDDLRHIMPDMLSTYTLNVEKPVVLTYEGVEGAKKAHKEVLAERKEILAYVLIDKKLDAPLYTFWPSYYRIRLKHNIYVRSICQNNKEGIEYQKQDKNHLRTTRLIPKEKFPFFIEKNICGDKVAFFSREEGKLISTIVINHRIAETERSIFEVAWREAEILDERIKKGLY